MGGGSNRAGFAAAGVAATAICYAVFSGSGRQGHLSDVGSTGLSASAANAANSSIGNKQIEQQLQEKEPVSITAPTPAPAAGYPRLPAVPRQGEAPVWSPDDLKLHTGSDPSRPLLLAILGEVYDVGTGAKHYAPGHGYAAFAGRDAGRGFAAGPGGGDDELNSRVLDLDAEDLQGILSWRDFYRNHESYRFVGLLAERYFDENGAPTPEILRIEDLHAAQGKVAKLREELQKRFAGCNSKHESAKTYFEVWCDDGYHGKGALPVHLYFQLPAQGLARNQAKPEKGGWCACLPPKLRAEAELAAAELVRRPQPGKATFRFVDYKECKKGAQKCQRPKGAMPP